MAKASKKKTASTPKKAAIEKDAESFAHPDGQPTYQDPEDEFGHPTDILDDENPENVKNVEQLLDIKRQVSDALASKTLPGIQSFGLGDPADDSNILGVGIGRPEVDFESTGKEGPGSSVLNVYVAEKVDVETIKAAMTDKLNVDGIASDSFGINIIQTGMIEASGRHVHKERPAPCGVSAGHHSITAGTLGALVRGRRGERRNRVLALSNNHVFANSNAAGVGDNILQPGRLDRGRTPQDRLALLESWVPIKFDGSPNLVDCATGWCWHELVRPEFFYQSRQGPQYFKVSNTPQSVRNGMAVGKSGRTTGLTIGQVYDTSVDIRVNFGASGVAFFRDQLAIRGTRGTFSAGGDSGSLIWTWDASRNPVGLLFAGGGQYTFANKINRVLDALDIEFVS